MAPRIPAHLQYALQVCVAAHPKEKRVAIITVWDLDDKDRVESVLKVLREFIAPDVEIEMVQALPSPNEVSPREWLAGLLRQATAPDVTATCTFCGRGNNHDNRVISSGAAKICSICINRLYDDTSLRRRKPPFTCNFCEGSATAKWWIEQGEMRICEECLESLLVKSPQRSL
jgi:hypothetical protein